jgi:hypothetical protein
MARTSVELHHFDASTSNGETQLQNTPNENSEPQTSNTEFSLPPVDTGKQAWLFLAACWGVEAVTFGEFFKAAQRFLQVDLLEGN